MKLFEAYVQAIEEEDDPLERAELSDSMELKTLIVEEIDKAFKDMRENKEQNLGRLQLIQPIFGCVAFWFVIGIRVGKILRDAEIARHVNG